MDPKRAGSSALFAPPADGGVWGGYSCPGGAGAEKPTFPGVDTHLVVPETSGEEMIRGRIVQALPALPLHADRQAALAGLFEWAIRPGYISSVELLTRVADRSNFATDLSIRKEGEDPATGQRYLEELSFEVINEQSMRDIREKAEDLIARGVRRMFGIFVKRKQVAEWSQATRDFVVLDLDSEIVDPCLSRPILVRALLDRTAAELELVKALAEKNSPALQAIREQAESKGREAGRKEGREEGREAGREEGREDARRADLEKGFKLKFGAISAAEKARLKRATGEELERWLERLFVAKSPSEVFADETTAQ